MRKFYDDYCNSHQLQHHAVVLQIKHYLQDHQAAIDTGNVEAANRVTNNINRLVNEYGVQALHQAQEEL
ncbi:hypothetical protein D3C75_625220 [compost metagenome]